jgi:hypothetical protein
MRGHDERLARGPSSSQVTERRGVVLVLWQRDGDETAGVE